MAPDTTAPQETYTLVVRYYEPMIIRLYANFSACSEKTDYSD
jgi:hypothetical protein